MTDNISASTPPYYVPPSSCVVRQETAGAVAWTQDGKLVQCWHIMDYGTAAARAYTEWRIVPVREVDTNG